MPTSKEAFQITDSLSSLSYVPAEFRAAAKDLPVSLRKVLRELDGLNVVATEGSEHRYKTAALGKIRRATPPVSKKNGFQGIRKIAPIEFLTSLWDAIVEELYEFFCKKGGKYQKDRSTLSHSIAAIAGAIATAIAVKWGFAGSAVDAIILAILMLILKLNKNAWCTVMKTRMSSAN